MKRHLTLAVVSLTGAFVAHFSFFFLLKIEGPARQDPPDSGVEVTYVGDLGIGSDPVLGQQAILHDSSPLFMPTKWNLASEMSSVASLNEATEVFASYSPDLTLPSFLPDQIPATQTVQLPSDFSLPDSPSFFLGKFGRVPIEWPSASPGSPSILASRFDLPEPQRVAPRRLPQSLADQAPGTLWAPIEYHLQIFKGKPVGFPVLAQGSGYSEWDQVLRDYVGSLSFYRDLKSGYYRITILP